MMLIGLGFKVSAAPFHVWTPDVYEGAPSPVVGLMSTAPKAAAFAVLLRLCFGTFASLNHHWFVLLWILAALSMTVGNLGCAAAAQCEADARIFIDRACGISVGRLHRAFAARHRCGKFLCGFLCSDECRRVCRHQPPCRIL